MKNLIGMVDFVFNQGETSTFDTDQGDWYFKEQNILDKIRSYARFLKQPLEPWMFVPCKLVDGVWMVLDEPKQFHDFEDTYKSVHIDSSIEMWYSKCKEYQQAKERCLFDRFELKEKVFNSESIKTICLHEFLNVFWWHKKENKWELSKGISTIEDLVKYNIQLTPTALKQLSL